MYLTSSNETLRTLIKKIAETDTVMHIKKSEMTKNLMHGAGFYLIRSLISWREKFTPACVITIFENICFTISKNFQYML